MQRHPIDAGAGGRLGLAEQLGGHHPAVPLGCAHERVPGGVGEAGLAAQGSRVVQQQALEPGEVEVETQDGEYDSTVVFQRQRVTGSFQLAAQQPLQVPFQFPVPWETPITAVGGGQLPGMTVGVRTELVIAGAPDKGDLDPLIDALVMVEKRRQH